VDRGPSRTAWPPLWLTTAAPATSTTAAATIEQEPLAAENVLPIEPDAPDSPPPAEAATQSNVPVAADPLADWILRPDVDGRMGWEPPGLSRAERWWAWYRMRPWPN
jgi:hypothetical protein